MHKVIETWVCIGGPHNGQRYQTPVGMESFVAIEKEPMPMTVKYNRDQTVKEILYTKRRWNDWDEQRTYLFWAMQNMTDDEVFQGFLCYALNCLVKNGDI